MLAKFLQQIVRLVLSLADFIIVDHDQTHYLTAQLLLFQIINQLIALQRPYLLIPYNQIIIQQQQVTQLILHFLHHHLQQLSSLPLLYGIN